MFWIVEVKIGKKWFPKVTALCHTRAEARARCEALHLDYPLTQFRVRAYVRGEKP